MRTETRYIADDGQTFVDQTLCEQYEEKIFKEFLDRYEPLAKAAIAIAKVRPEDRREYYVSDGELVEFGLRRIAMFFHQKRNELKAGEPNPEHPSPLTKEQWAAFKIEDSKPNKKLTT